MGVYTKTGDEGKTSLYTGERVEKCSLRVRTYGTVDEADSALAMARAFSQNAEVKKKLFTLQKLMPMLMADLASIGQEPMIQMEQVEALERQMDEIEAALDDSNVSRYAEYLHKLTRDTQFIVITHRRGTMEQVDRLYGITMQEKGVSTLVSVNLIDKELDD